MSAVSKSVIPCSSAASITATVCVVVDPHPEVVRAEPDDRHLGPALLRARACACPRRYPRRRPRAPMPLQCENHGREAVAESGTKPSMGSDPQTMLDVRAQRPRPPSRYASRRQRSRMDDRQRLRRARQGDVELAQAGVAALFLDQRGLDDDDVVELEALRLARRQHRQGDLVERLAGRRRVGERARRDHGEQAVELRRLADRDAEQLVLGAPRRAAAGRRPAGTRADAPPRARSGRAAAARSP